MQRAVDSAAPVESFASAFEHSITWEDDIWSADPVDVAAVHKQARAKFQSALDSIVKSDGAVTPARLLVHGRDIDRVGTPNIVFPGDRVLER